MSAAKSTKFPTAAALTEELSRMQRLVRFQVELWRYCARRLWQHNVMAMSSALAFRTIFAMTPALVLSLLVVKSLGVLENSKTSLRDFLDAAGVGQITLSEGEENINAADKLMEIVTSVENKLTLGRIGPIGVLLLIWTALTLMMTLEGALNRICEAPRSRSLKRRLTMYWSVLSLGPVVMLTVRYLAGKITESVASVGALAWLLEALGWAGPVLTGLLLLALMYKIVPNTRVQFRAAIGGALVAVPLWLVAKWAFRLYVTRVAAGSLYGAIGLLPLFLIWINWSWVVLLFGAEVSYTAANLRRLRRADLAGRLALGPEEMLAVTMAVAEPFHKGEGPVAFEAVCKAINLPDESISSLLERLEAKQVVSRVADEGGDAFVLARPAERIGLLEVIDLHQRDGQERLAGSNRRIRACLQAVRRQAQATLGNMTLAQVIEEMDSEMTKE
ncbi:MAG: YihY family inner membrane protein [Sedimentisphaerales bacterium]|nr:YihY family inner membrane protein [Sedimentisphaerales bacterium]